MGISILSILVVLLILGIIVTLHEMGHFWVARLLKIKAFEVSIFVGPKLFSWKKNGVDYSIRAVPLGAYVRFSDFDENGDPIESDDPDLLINQKRWKRLLVALAGPFMNLVLGILLFVIMFSSFFMYTTRLGLTSKESQLALAVEEQYPDTMIGDYIESINGHKVYTYLDILYEINNGIPERAEMDLGMRSWITGETYELKLMPDFITRPMLGITYYNGLENQYNGWRIESVNDSQNDGHPILQEGDYLVAVDGMPVSDPGFEDYFGSLTTDDTMHLTFYRNDELMEADCSKTFITYIRARGVDMFPIKVDSWDNFVLAVKTAVKMPVSVVHVTGRVFQEVFRGDEEVYNMVSGPVGMTSAVSQVVDDQDISFLDKLFNVINISAMISLGLVVSNMLPIPGLDGVQVMYIFYEMISGRPINKKAEMVITVIGFVILIGLAIFALSSDIIRIFVGM